MTETMSKKIERNEIKKIVFSSGTIALLFVASAWIFQLYQPLLENMVKNESTLGMFVYVLIFILSIVFLPISSMPLIPIGAKIWGVYLTTILSAGGWTIGAMIAFYLSRHFASPYVVKLLGTKKIQKIEKMIPEENIFLTIFFLRAVTPFDGLSYGLGLIPRVKTRTFFFATALGLLPFCFLIAILGSLPAIWLSLGLLLAVIFFLFGIYRLNNFWLDKNTTT